jgi:hypothetical protein
MVYTMQKNTLIKDSLDMLQEVDSAIMPPTPQDFFQNITGQNKTNMYILWCAYDNPYAKWHISSTFEGQNSGFGQINICALKSIISTRTRT